MNIGAFLNTHWVESEEEDAYIRNEEEVRGVELHTVIGSDYLRRFFVIVEMYHRKNFGKGKRRYLAEFTSAERKVLSRWYLKIYGWMMKTGIPRGGVRMSIGTYNLLCRFADFFASLT